MIEVRCICAEERKETHLDTCGFVQLVRFHVYDFSRLAIDTPRMLPVRMFCLQKKKRRKKM